MTPASCDQPEKRVADDMADEVLALAAKYYAEQQASFSESELIAAGSEVSIPPELINKAIAEIAYQKQQATLAAQVLKENRRLLFGIAGGMLAMTGGLLMLSYNTLMSAAARVDAAWAQVDNQMQRRADLLPTLTLIAQAPNHRKPTLVKVLQAASQSSKAALTTEEKIAASQQVDAAVTIFSNTYIPAHGSELKQGELVEIHYEMVGTANRLAVERMRFNQAVDSYNRTISLFPNSLLANAMGLRKRGFATPQLPPPQSR
jgi:LemA protein